MRLPPELMERVRTQANCGLQRETGNEVVCVCPEEGEWVGEVGR